MPVGLPVRHTAPLAYPTISRSSLAFSRSSLAFSRSSPSHVPCKSRRPGSRRLYAGRHLASNRVSARLTPRAKLNLGFDAIYEAFDASTATPDQTFPAERFWRVFLVPT
jgi:hypothetical protein